MTYRFPNAFHSTMRFNQFSNENLLNTSLYTECYFFSLTIGLNMCISFLRNTHTIFKRNVFRSHAVAVRYESLHRANTKSPQNYVRKCRFLSSHQKQLKGGNDQPKGILFFKSKTRPYIHINNGNFISCFLNLVLDLIIAKFFDFYTRVNINNCCIFVIKNWVEIAT